MGVEDSFGCEKDGCCADLSREWGLGVGLISSGGGDLGYEG